MSREARGAPERARTRSEGRIRDDGHIECGVCGGVAYLSDPAVLATAGTRYTARQARRLRYVYSDRWGWAHRGCKRRADRELQAGHRQLELFG